MPITFTLAGIHSYIGTKRLRVTTVIRMLLFCDARLWITGTVMATSPMAEKRITRSLVSPDSFLQNNDINGCFCVVAKWAILQTF